MNKIIFLFFIIFFACKSDNNDIQQIIKNDDNQLNNNTENKFKLIKTVLNHPVIIKYSKIELIKKNFKNIYLLNNLELNQNSIILVGDTKISLLDENSKINFESYPCYFFERLEINEKEANVLMFFDITGAFAEGKFYLFNGEWIPSDNFKIGVR
jgi:hypothetical protein